MNRTAAPPHAPRAVVLILAAAACLTGCDNADANRAGETTLDRIRRTGVIRIAYANEEPFGYLDTETGRVTGEAPQIARVVAERLDIDHVEPILTEWKSLIPGLRAGRFDVIAAGMYITPQRAENVAFSDPTYRIGEAFLVRSGNPKRLGGFEDVADHPDAMLGMVRGTVEREYARQLGVPDDRVVLFPDNNSGVAGLQAGRVDAFAVTALTARTLLSKLGDGAGLELARPFQQPVIDGRTAYGYGAFAFRPADTALRDAFNDVLRDYLGTEEHQSLVAPFGFTESEMTGGLTADQVLEQSRTPSP